MIIATGPGMVGSQGLISCHIKLLSVYKVISIIGPHTCFSDMCGVWGGGEEGVSRPVIAENMSWCHLVLLLVVSPDHLLCPLPEYLCPCSQSLYCNIHHYHPTQFVVKCAPVWPGQDYKIHLEEHLALHENLIKMRISCYWYSGKNFTTLTIMNR